MPGAKIVGGDLGDELEAVGDVEGSPGLVAIGTDRADVAGSATVGAQAPVIPTLALLGGKGPASSTCPVDVHSGGVVARWLVLLQT